MKKKKTNEIIDLITIPMKNAPLTAVILGIQRLLEGFLPTLKILVTAKFLDDVIDIYNMNKTLNDINSTIVLLMGIIAYQWISDQVGKFAEVKLENNLRNSFRVTILKKVATLKYKYIENEKSWDLISRVSKDPETRCKNAYVQTLEMIAMIIRVLGVLAILFTKVWWSTIIILCISVPLFMLAFKSGKENYQANRETEKYNRKVKYLDEILNGRDARDERSIFGYSEYINKEWEKAFETSRKIIFKVRLKWFINSKLGSIIIAILSVLILLILIGPVKQGLLSIGMFISIEDTVFNLVQVLAWQLPNYGDYLSQNKEYIVDLNNLMNLESDEEALASIPKYNIKLKTLEFRNVSFKYNGSKEYILKNMSFTIKKGKNYAFVGKNGAGKTTITKLITGLYDEFEGDILINGTSIRKFNQSDIKSLCSVVYQDFAKYNISFKDNILLGNTAKSVNDTALKNVINLLGLEKTVNILPKGIDTNLGKIKSDSIDISGGEWQRVAMARTMLSNSSLAILDEPTAALDPISESRIYEEFNEISKDKTTIFISHRLASTKLADTIYVIENGIIIEKGSYEELMKENGVYAQMYNSQRSWYLNE